jgi:toxin ParE1/3/4
VKGFVLSPAAIADLDAIWDYTADQWSIAQADRYVGQIRREIVALVDGSVSGRSIDAVRKGYFKRSAGSHFIVYRTVDDVVDVMRILHNRMDIPDHLSSQQS